MRTLPAAAGLCSNTSAAAALWAAASAHPGANEALNHTPAAGLSPLSGPPHTCRRQRNQTAADQGQPERAERRYRDAPKRGTAILMAERGDSPEKKTARPKPPNHRQPSLSWLPKIKFLLKNQKRKKERIIVKVLTSEKAECGRVRVNAPLLGNEQKKKKWKKKTVKGEMPGA